MSWIWMSKIRLLRCSNDEWKSNQGVQAMKNLQLDCFFVCPQMLDPQSPVLLTHGFDIHDRFEHKQTKCAIMNEHIGRRTGFLNTDEL
jgi:hypothetical protein